jgi:hypothetical protein
MKKSFGVLVVIALFICLPLKGQTNNAKEEAEIKAVIEREFKASTCLLLNGLNYNETEEATIKAVIEGEIKASFDGDYNTWASYFVHEPYLVWMQAWKDGKSCWKGWQEISAEAKNFLKPERKGSIIFNGNYDYTIRIYDNAAYVSFKCKSTNMFGQSKESDAMEVRLLEKHYGNWKIAYLSSIYLSTY